MRIFVSDESPQQVLAASQGRVTVLVSNLSGVNVYLHSRPETVKEVGLPVAPGAFFSLEWYGDLWAQSDAGQAEFALLISEGCR